MVRFWTDFLSCQSANSLPPHEFPEAGGAPPLRSTPRPASPGTVCWGSLGPWPAGWAGWPAPPRWAPSPPPPPSASPAASAAPALPLCWSSGCHCRARAKGWWDRASTETEGCCSTSRQHAHLRHLPGFTAAVYVISPHSGAECGVELLLFVVLQVEGLQGVHGPVEQRIIQQHLYRGTHRGDA